MNPVQPSLVDTACPPLPETMRPAIIIPVYNHHKYISEVVAGAKDLAMPIFVVDDGSTDATGKIIDAMGGITILRHPTNKGKGAALLTGFAAAFGQHAGRGGGQPESRYLGAAAGHCRPARLVAIAPLQRGCRQSRVLSQY